MSNRVSLKQFVVSAAVLLLIAAFIFAKSFSAEQVLFANDGPLGLLTANSSDMSKAWRGKWQGFAVAAACGTATLLLDPRWPAKWLTAMSEFSGARLHFVPVLIPFGFLLLIALLRWREPAARVLLPCRLFHNLLFCTISSR